MGLDRTKVVEEQFLTFVRSWNDQAPHNQHKINHLDLSKKDWIDLIESQMRSRLIDLEARILKNQSLSYYTIGSSGHEGNAVLGRILRKTDPCLLHYRSGGLMMERGRKSSNDFLQTSQLIVLEKILFFEVQFTILTLSQYPITFLLVTHQIFFLHLFFASLAILE